MLLSKLEALQKQDNFLLWLATKHHKTNKDEFLTFKNHKYLKALYLDQSKYIVVIKSTQCGISEYLSVRAMSQAIQGLYVFYVLPTFDLVSLFVKGRIEKSIQYTKYYREIERIKKETAEGNRTDNIKSKDIGNGNIAFVGSNSSAGFTSYPADSVIVDELEECDPDNLSMAWERLSHSQYRLQIKVSNPKFEGKGIDAEYAQTDKREWFIQCDCGNKSTLDFFKNVVKEVESNEYIIRDSDWDWNCGRDILPLCEKCGRPLDRFSDGQWVTSVKSDKRGYRINKLFSGTTTLVEILNRFQAGLTNPIEMQRFYNADLGMAYTASGAKITIAELNSCVVDYLMPSNARNCIMGVDVNVPYFNVIICTYGEPKTRLVFAGTVREPEEVITLWRKYGCIAGIIDAMPETRIATKLCNTLGTMQKCYFGNGKHDSYDPLSHSFTVQRTASIDAVHEGFLLKAIALPKNAQAIPELYDQLTASVRVFVPEANKGEGAYQWVEGSKADHFLLAFVYCLLAKKVLQLI